MKATVDHRKDAKPGDMLWVWDSWRPRPAERGVPFERGVMLLRRVTEINRVTVTVSGTGRFDIGTGKARQPKGGHTPLYPWAGGEVDKQLYLYVLDRNVIGRELDRASPEQLKQVAEIFGFSPEDPPVEVER